MNKNLKSYILRPKEFSKINKNFILPIPRPLRPGDTFTLRNGDKRTLIVERRLGLVRYNTINECGEVQLKWFETLEEVRCWYRDLI